NGAPAFRTARPTARRDDCAALATELRAGGGCGRPARTRTRARARAPPHRELARIAPARASNPRSHSPQNADGARSVAWRDGRFLGLGSAALHRDGTSIALR